MTNLEACAAANQLWESATQYRRANNLSFSCMGDMPQELMVTVAAQLQVGSDVDAVRVGVAEIENMLIRWRQGQ